MIFVTVGTQLPFDRLIELVDVFAKKTKTKIVGQIGPGEYQPKAISWQRYFGPEDFAQILKKARVVVAHAGMGSIISCIEKEKPLIIFPRLKVFGEHRNDHQLDTVKAFTEYPGIYAASSGKELDTYLTSWKTLAPPAKSQSSELIALERYIVSCLEKTESSS